MWWLNNSLLLARYRWVADLGNALAKAAENREPTGYIAVAVCWIVVIGVIVLFAREWYRFWKGTPLEGGLYELIFSSILLITIPILFLHEVGWWLW